MSDLYNKQIRLSFGKNFSIFLPQTVNFLEIPKIVCSKNVLYSAAQFKDNKRKAENFLGHADIIILDFDEGWNEYHEELFNNYIGFKVPTKSHMKEKNGIVCERYRIILLLDKPIMLDYSNYKKLYKHIMKDLNLESDTSCVDACRFYYSSEQPIENCVRLKGSQYFNWEKFNYQDFNYAKLVHDNIDISRYEGMDLSYLENLNPSKRYPCPLCVLEGLDQKGHHLGFNKDKNYPSCFYDEEHSKILRKLFSKYKNKVINTKIEELIEMGKEKCTSEQIKIGKRDPHPTNYSNDLLDLYNKSLDEIEKDTLVDIDIETFSEYFVDETVEEAEARLGKEYKYIKNAYKKAEDEYKDIALDPLKNKIRIITLSGNGAVCPFDMYYVTEEQKQRILNIIKTKILIGHNIKFDLRSIQNKYGWDVLPPYCFDTMIGSRMIHMATDVEDQQAGHNLEATAFRFLGFRMDKHIEHSWGNDNLLPEQLKYCGMDVKVLRPIFKEQLKQLSQLYGQFDTSNYDMKEIEYLGPFIKVHPVIALEMQTVLEMIRLENYGVKSNIPMLSKTMEEYDRVIEQNDAELGINCGSSKQCVEFLKKNVDEKIESSSKEALLPYNDNPIVQKITAGKEARTRRGLMEAMSKTCVHPYDGRIHASFNQLLSTGRFSCKDPNMQQIPRGIKNSVYQAEEDGVAYDCDYAAVELRLVTVVSGDEKMLDAYSKNTDMHYLTANLLLGKKIPHTPEEKEDAEKNPNSEFISKADRNLAKYFNFGLVYGVSKESFTTLLLQSNPDVSAPQAAEYYDKYFESYTGIARTIKNAKSTFMYGSNKKVMRWIKSKDGHLFNKEAEVPFFTQCTTLIGRKLAVDNPRKLLNYPVQGSGADAIKFAITKLGYTTRNIKSSHRTINMVHDDTIGECRIYDFDINSKIFRDSLEWAINFVLRRKFFTPVDDDFCVLSLCGEEVFLENSFTLKDIKTNLRETMKHDYEKLLEAQKENNAKDVIEYSEKLNRENRAAKKFDDKLKELGIVC